MTEHTPAPDDSNLTLAALVRAMRDSEAIGLQDFWSTVLHRFNVSKVAFSKHLPDDQYGYRLAAMPDMGTPATLILPEKYRREFPPLPSILDLTYPKTRFLDPPYGGVYLGPDGVYEADGEGIRRVSEPLEGEPVPRCTPINCRSSRPRASSLSGAAMPGPPMAACFATTATPRPTCTSASSRWPFPIKRRSISLPMTSPTRP